MRDILVKK